MCIRNRSIATLKGNRKKSEKALTKAKKGIPFPGWEALDAEMAQETPAVYLTVKDATGNVIKTIKGKNSKGLQRVNWDLSLNSKGIVRLNQNRGGFFGGGPRATPGTYSVTLSKLVDGTWTDLSEPQSFEVVPLMEPHLKGASYDEMVAFRNDFQTFQNDMTLTRSMLSKSKNKVNAMRVALSRADRPSPMLLSKLHQAKKDLHQLDIKLNGSKAKAEVGEKNDPTPGNGMFLGYVALSTTYGPTGNHKKAFNASKSMLADLKTEIAAIANTTIPALMDELKATGAPMIEE